MLLSESVSSGLSGGDNSVLGGLIAAGTLIALNLSAGIIGSRHPKAEAILAGSDFLVVARPILNAPDPVAAAREMVAEIDQALRARSRRLPRTGSDR
jgi:hypothetical protein